MIVLDKTSSVPQYLQVYEGMKKNILNSYYSVAEKLPSVRELAIELGVSRNTIDKAYRQLYAEGYVRIAERTGYFVEEGVLDAVELSHMSPPPHVAGPLEGKSQKKTLTYDFFYGDLPDSLFPARIWRSLTNAVLQEPLRANSYTDSLGKWELRDEIARYLHRARGVECATDQVVLQMGIRDGFERIIKLFDPETCKIGFEDPGFPGLRAVCANNRVTAVPLDISSYKQFFASLERSGVRIVYVTPSHQFPTGKTMPVAERIKLLEWAERRDAYIIEDDYDSEFRYGQRPIPSLQSLDRAGRVIYTGTFSKVLSPGLRTGYWVLPPVLLDGYYEKLACYRCPVPWLTQEVLQKFFSEGHWERYVRKTVQTYKHKRSVLIDAITTHLGGNVSVFGESAGLHLWLKMNDPRPNNELERLAAEAGVGVYTTDRYWLDASKVDRSTLLLGYSGIETDQIEPGIAVLGKAWFGNINGTRRNL